MPHYRRCATLVLNNRVFKTHNGMKCNYSHFEEIKQDGFSPEEVLKDPVRLVGGFMSHSYPWQHYTILKMLF